MNWHVFIAGIIALLGLSTVSLAPVSAPRISWIGEKVEGSLMIPTLTPTSAPRGPIRKMNDSLGVDLTARAALMIDPESGEALYEMNPDQVRTIASITKLMSIMIVIDRLEDPSTLVEIMRDDIVPYGTTTLRVGEKVKAQDLIAAAIIGSDNTAITALARHTGVSRAEFVEAMNARAKDLGLSKTSFADVTGLLDANVSTARDVVRLARIAFAYRYVSEYAGRRTHSFTSEDGREHTVRTTNRLIGSFISVVHGKTGFVTEAGYNLVAEVRDAAEHTVLGVVLGSATNDDRFHDFKMMAYWVWQNFTWPAN
jgi:D-alanyl-D-alanine endopeptidase (penicillin-binding protein 7)